ncbi:MAG: universal stress protein [Desulfovibrio sp.]|nr:universal stress protein [Desulfovibrio sp.]
MYSKILVPISAKNLEIRARAVLLHALALNPETNKILLLYVTEPISGLVGGQSHAQLKREQEEEGRVFLHTAINTIGERSFAVRIEEGTVAETIVRVAHEEKSDLIIMFTDGRDSLQDALLGSITERVLRLSDIALLAIRH